MVNCLHFQELSFALKRIRRYTYIHALYVIRYTYEDTKYMRSVLLLLGQNVFMFPYNVT